MKGRKKEEKVPAPLKKGWSMVTKVRIGCSVCKKESALKDTVYFRTEGVGMRLKTIALCAEDAKKEGVL